MDETRFLLAGTSDRSTLANALCPWPRSPFGTVEEDSSHVSVQTAAESCGTSPTEYALHKNRACQDRRLTKHSINIILTVATAGTQVAMNALLPMYTDALQKHVVCGQPRVIGGEYFVLFFTSAVFALLFALLTLLAKVFLNGFQLTCPVPQRVRILCGLANTLNGILYIYASPPDRTPVSLQPLLTTAVIPFTVVARYVMLRKGINTPRLICTLAAMVGLIISMEPVIFKLNSNQGGKSSRGQQQWIWSLIFLSCFAPLAIMNVLEEGVFKNPRAGKRQDIGSLMFIFWIMVWTFFTQAALFFTDFIPWFGQSRNFNQFSQSMKEGFKCMFGSAPSPYSYPDCTAQYLNSTQHAVGTFNPDPNCSTPIMRFWLLAGFFCSTNLTLLMLVKYSEGAIYAVLVASLNAPMGAVFWMLFHLDRLSHFSWKPTFDQSTVYVFVGLVIIAPAVALYNYLGHLEEKRLERERLFLSAADVDSSDDFAKEPTFTS